MPNGAPGIIPYDDNYRPYAATSNVLLASTTTNLVHGASATALLTDTSTIGFKTLVLCVLSDQPLEVDVYYGADLVTPAKKIFKNSIAVPAAGAAPLTEGSGSAYSIPIYSTQVRVDVKNTGAADTTELQIELTGIGS